jgi:hypothetical protein
MSQLSYSYLFLYSVLLNSIFTLLVPFVIAMYHHLSHSLLYFPADKSFDIRSIDNEAINEDTFETLLSRREGGDFGCSLTIKAEYSGIFYNAVVVMLGMSENDLKPIMEYCVNVKKRPYNLRIDQILAFVPLVHTGKRISLPNPRVSSVVIT